MTNEDDMRLIDANALKFTKVAEVNGVLTHILTAEDINNAQTVEPKTKLVANVTIDKEQMEELVEKAKADILAQVEPCYQTTSCLDCGNYDKENHNCPRYCEVIKEAIKSRPQGEWIEGKNGNIKCNRCGAEIRYTYLANNKSDFPKFCCDCGADMRGEEE